MRTVVAAGPQGQVRALLDGAHKEVALSEHGWSPNSPDGRGRAAAEEPGDTVWRLRSRGCWQEAAELLRPAAEHDPAVALARAELLIEQCLFTASQWPQAEQALRLAEALAEGTEQRAAAACARGFLAYLASVLGPRDRLDEAQAALGRTSALLPPDAPGRPLLDFRRGLVAENLLRDRGAAWIAYRRAHEGAGERGDELLRSYTWRHLAALALSRGERGNAREGFDASLHGGGGAGARGARRGVRAHRGRAAARRGRPSGARPGRGAGLAGTPVVQHTPGRCPYAGVSPGRCPHAGASPGRAHHRRDPRGNQLR